MLSQLGLQSDECEGTRSALLFFTRFENPTQGQCPGLKSFGNKTAGCNSSLLRTYAHRNMSTNTHITTLESSN